MPCHPHSLRSPIHPTPSRPRCPRSEVRNPTPTPPPRSLYTHQRTLSPVAEAASVLFGRASGRDVRTEKRDILFQADSSAFFLRINLGFQPALKCVQTTKYAQTTITGNAHSTKMCYSDKFSTSGRSEPRISRFFHLSLVC